MSNIIYFPKHDFIKDEFYHNSGLAHCWRCGGAEVELPSDCPGVTMTQDQKALITAGELDYRFFKGGWTTWTRDKEMAVRMKLT